MVDNLIVADQNGLHIQCLYHGYKKENLVCHSFFLKQGEILTITNRKKYIVDVGWFVLIQIDNNKEEFMFVKDLEEAIHNEKMLNEIDCMLKISSISYYLDQSLVCWNKEEFLKYSAMRNELAYLYERLCEKALIGS